MWRISLGALLPIFAGTAHATIGGRCTDVQNLGAGSLAWSGICIRTNDCKARGGTSISGMCPGDPSSVQCCYINSCNSNSPQGFSYCEWMDHGCSLGTVSEGEWLDDYNYCPGPSDYQCCDFASQSKGISIGVAEARIKVSGRRRRRTNSDIAPPIA